MYIHIEIILKGVHQVIKNLIAYICMYIYFWKTNIYQIISKDYDCLVGLSGFYFVCAFLVV